jgi:hypothetical protein
MTTNDKMRQSMYPSALAAPVMKPITRQVQRTGLALALCLCVSLAHANTESTVTEFKPAAVIPAVEPTATLPATEPAAAVPAEDAAETATPPGTEAATPEPGAVPATIEAATPPAPVVSPGMQIPVDGTSVEAFDASLAEIQEKTTASEYITLTNAIKYMMVYDLTAKRDRAKLAANLNGLTGEQIIDRVNWRRDSPKTSTPPKIQAPPEQTATEPSTPDGQ